MEILLEEDHEYENGIRNNASNNKEDFFKTGVYLTENE
jgi:hypothetical protein